MTTSEAQKRARDKWLKNKVEEIKFRVPTGHKKIIQEHAKAQGESVNAFILRSVNAMMELEAEKMG